MLYSYAFTVFLSCTFADCLGYIYMAKRQERSHIGILKEETD